MAARKPKYEKGTDDPKVQESIRHVVDDAPPLTPAQTARLRGLFATATPLDLREAAGSAAHSLSEASEGGRGEDVRDRRSGAAEAHSRRVSGPSDQAATDIDESGAK